MTISIDPEFKSLIPSLTDEEFSGLEASILKEGRARVPLDVWNGILIDGHNRFTICQRHNLPFTTQEVGKPDWTRTDAKIWIRRNQLHRRTLDSLTRCEVALGLEEDLRKTGLANKREAGKKRTAEAIRGDTGQLLQISVKANSAADEPPMTAPAPKRVIKPVNTRKEISKAAGVSHDTLAKAKVILAKAPEAVKEAIRSGKTTINREYKEIMKEQKQREFEKMHEAIIKSLPDRAERYNTLPGKA